MPRNPLEFQQSLNFNDGAPSKATAQKLYDHIDLTHGYNAYGRSETRS